MTITFLIIWKEKLSSYCWNMRFFLFICVGPTLHTLSNKHCKLWGKKIILHFAPWALKFFFLMVYFIQLSASFARGQRLNLCETLWDWFETAYFPALHMFTLCTVCECSLCMEYLDEFIFVQKKKRKKKTREHSVEYCIPRCNALNLTFHLMTRLSFCFIKVQSVFFFLNTHLFSRVCHLLCCVIPKEHIHKSVNE